MYDWRSINEGFSKKAEVYDAYCDAHPVIRWAREVIRREVLLRVGVDGAILELNAGTGSDAEFFVQKGCIVHATDVADGMLRSMQIKIQALSQGGRFSSQKISFTDLEGVQGGPFDLIFSNFGGLNCIADLQVVARSLPRLLRPGGVVVWVVMPPVCPWELIQIGRGNFHVATRRLHHNGTLANVEGAQIRTWYFSPGVVQKSMGPEFRLLRRQSISMFGPPSYMDRFPNLYPRLTKFLLGLDEMLGGYFPFNLWGDFVMYTFRYEP